MLSLFDGMSCGRLALKKSGIKVDKYLASEIKSFAINHTLERYPDTISIGDVTKVYYDRKTKTYNIWAIYYLIIPKFGLTFSISVLPPFLAILG